MTYEIPKPESPTLEQNFFGLYYLMTLDNKGVESTP